ncbi:MAG TPA: hypothetical protein DHW49_12840 [Anaerolineae bacterium]|nr:hypothetical protein [Anaerolineae bacterium]
MKLEGSENLKNISFKILLVFLAVIFLPVILIIGILYYVWGFILSFMAWTIWGLQGRNTLLIYSDSPIWLNYFEQEVLPYINKKVIVLNWSERKQWKLSLAVLIFKHFGRRQNFNPMAIVFKPFRFNKEFRFYEAFKDFKHGKFDKLEITKEKFLESI